MLIVNFFLIYAPYSVFLMAHSFPIQRNFDFSMSENTPKSFRDARVKSFFATVTSLGPALGLSSVIYFDQTNYIKLRRKLFDKYIRPGNRVLEVGYGSGANNDIYPSGVNLIGLDPVMINNRESMSFRNLKKRNINFSFVQGIAEDIPFPDNSFDVVVTTKTLCTVQNPTKTIQEVIRILKDGGVYVCVEHIHGNQGSFLALQQDILDPLSVSLSNGCHLTRETDKLLLNSIIFQSGDCLERIDNRADNSSPDAHASFGRPYDVECRSNVTARSTYDQNKSTSNGLQEKRYFKELLEVFIKDFPTEWPVNKQIFFAARK